jgi:hypothetical protein
MVESNSYIKKYLDFSLHLAIHISYFSCRGINRHNKKLNALSVNVTLGEILCNESFGYKILTWEKICTNLSIELQEENPFPEDDFIELDSVICKQKFANPLSIKYYAVILLLYQLNMLL